jgi:hypothetical protein
VSPGVGAHANLDRPLPRVNRLATVGLPPPRRFLREPSRSLCLLDGSFRSTTCENNAQSRKSAHRLHLDQT